MTDSRLGSSVPDEAISTVAETEGDEGDGDGFGGRLASTGAVPPMTRATARTAATRTIGTRELIGLRIGRLPRFIEPRFCRSLRRPVADRFSGC
jgi:hypothetical protein